jgi:predicted NUDIX family NTP pyrophosphohydrolase
VLDVIGRIASSIGLRPREYVLSWLTPIKQKGGKIVNAWAFKGDCDPNAIKCNTCTIEWPPHSGQQMEIPEIDRVEFFDLDVAKKKIKAGQEGLIEEFEGINRL